MSIDHASPAPGFSEWLRWPTGRVAHWVADRPKPVVVGWPFNGTRRWYLAHRDRSTSTNDYLTTIIRRQAELHRMTFDHGVSVIAAPGFGQETMKRGSTYTQYVLSGLLRLADDEVYQEMFAAGMRLRFYGDYEEVLDEPVFRPMLDACAELTEATASGDGPLLLIGLFADAPYPTIARLSVEFLQKRGRIPNRQELIEAYYGVPVPDLSLYIGFVQPEMFDVPLLADGLEHLYTTLNPSPGLTHKQLREILYDHLVTRQAPPVDYESLPTRAREEIIEYNERHKGLTLGLGHIDPVTGLWRPSLPNPEPHGEANSGTLSE